jgi:catechol 2,3-dioxygenase-like lactoylglutathione lyase family enzyme
MAAMQFDTAAPFAWWRRRPPLTQVVEFRGPAILPGTARVAAPGSKEEPVQTNNKEPAMLDHTGIVVSDLVRSRRFYDAIAKPLGLGAKEMTKDFFLFGRGENSIPYLWIGTLRPSYWAAGSSPALNQMHVAFVAPSKQAVDEFYTAGIAAGGRDNGAPGSRNFAEKYYAAFVLDPDGNNIEAVYRGD